MKFIALYKAPVSSIEDWMKKPAEERAAEEKQMQEDWRAWEAKHGLAGNTMATGKTSVVTKDGVALSRNDIMLYTVVEADTQDAAAAIFMEHPHLVIPGATIEIMPIRPM